MTNTAAVPPPTRPQPTPSEQHKRIQNQLQTLLTALQRREPLDSSYDQLLPPALRKRLVAAASGGKTIQTNKPDEGGTGGTGGTGATTTTGTTSSKKSNVLTADAKLHKKFNAHLRSTVETYASTPAGWRRRPNTRRIDVDFGTSSDKSGSGKEESSKSSTTVTTDKDGIESKLRAAFALRESKEHEQRDLVNATLKAENAKLRRGWGLSQVTSSTGMGIGGVGGGGGAAPMMGMLPPLEEAGARKKRLDGIARQLREVEKGAGERAKWKKVAEKGKIMIFDPRAAKAATVKKSPEEPPKPTPNKESPTPTTEAIVRDAKRKRQDPEDEYKQQVEEAKKRDRALRERLEREEQENKRRIEKEREEKERRERAVETPRDALHRVYEPVFTALWDMEFANLGGTNPFRMVIDASTCAEMGIPDYCDVIEKPMNLTFIQTKVNNKSYETLQEFCEDVELIVRNALLYNSNPDNAYHIAAKEFRKKYRKLVKPIVQKLTKGQGATDG